MPPVSDLVMAYSKASLNCSGAKATPCFRPFWIASVLVKRSSLTMPPFYAETVRLSSRIIRNQRQRIINKETKNNKQSHSEARAHNRLLFQYYYNIHTSPSKEVSPTKILKKVSVWIYDMIYLLTAIGPTPGGSSTVHIYTQTVHRTTQ